MPSSMRPGVVIAAGVLLLLALGLPWSVSSMAYIPGWYDAGTCMPNLAEGTVYCTGGFVAPGRSVGSGASHGVDTVARVFLVGALVLMAVARRQGRSVWLTIAGAVVLLGVLLTGLAAQGGQLAALAAAALLLSAGFSDRADGRAVDPRVAG